MAATTPYKRELPFLHGGWKRSVEAFKSAVGVIQLSSTNGDKPLSGNHTPRPTKRRRITEDSLDSGAVSAIASLFREPPQDFERALRVQVLQIGTDEFHERGLNGFVVGNGAPARKDTSSIKATCRLTIFRYKPNVELRALYCDSQACDMELLRDPDGACRNARIRLQHAFYITAEKLYIYRGDGEPKGLADEYLIQTELESHSGEHPNWPPLDLLRGQELHRPSLIPPREWTLSSRFSYRLVKGRVSTTVSLRKSTGNDIETDLVMDTDLRWSSPHVANSAPRPLEENTPPDIKAPSLNGALEPLTNGHVNGRVEHLTNGHGKDDQDVEMDDDDADADGEAITPSRSLRMRGKETNYNLKVMSDKAIGKELKEKKKRKEAAAALEAGQVMWILPASGPVQIPNWSCIRCFATHSSFEQLKMHVSVHIEFKFTFDCSPRGGRRILISPHGQETPRSIRTSELQEPPSPEEHEVDSGDEMTPPKPGPQPRPKPVSRRPAFVRPRNTKQVIPNIKQPMFDRISKALFEPGSRVDEPQVDNSWLYQKHRDIIKDYTDVHADEKEYVSEWDAFSISRKATLSPHLQDIYLAFLEEKASWLAASQNRMNEAMKHLTYLTARDALSEDTVAQALEIARQARTQARDGSSDQAKASSPNKETRPSKSGCAVCDQPIAGPSQLICSNLSCKRPFYHDDCIRDEAEIPVETRNWYCNDCCGNRGQA